MLTKIKVSLKNIEAHSHDLWRATLRRRLLARRIFLSQSHGEHGGVSDFPRVNISTQTPSVPLCLFVRPPLLTLL
jgi:hypothetical protein